MENEAKKPVTELSFLLELLLNHKLALTTKNMIKDRIAEVEAGYSLASPAGGRNAVRSIAQAQVSVPVEAQTPAAQAALAQRAAVMANALADDPKPKGGRDFTGFQRG